MKVLIISHNVFSKTGNMGKTLSNYFGAFGPHELAQFYIHSEVPTDRSICQNYYRFTDRDAIRSIIPLKNHGHIYHPEDIQTDRSFSRTDSGMIKQVYQFGRQRTGTIYLARNLVWKLSHWFTKELKSWLHDFDPDVIFFASGDYSFMYVIARKIAQYLNKPLIIACVDDYYVYSANEQSVIGRLEHKLFLRSVRSAMAYASAITTICESMADIYSGMFHRPAYVMHTPAKSLHLELNPAARQISYMGNLGYGRDQQLISLSRALSKLNYPGGPHVIDVYSGEKNPEILNRLAAEKGISFHGLVPAEKVLKIMENSMAVIHTESFDENTKSQVRFSVSTKIAESLMYAPCLLAYGPNGIASIDYLKDNRAAFVITDRDNVCEKLSEFLSNSSLRQEILRNARRIGAKNHNVEISSQNLKAWIRKIVWESNTDENISGH